MEKVVRVLGGIQWVGQQAMVNSNFLSCCCSVTQSCLTLCSPMDCSTPGFPILHHLLEFAQTCVH